MSELQIIERTLARTAKRRRWERAWRGLWRGLLWGGVAWLACLISFKLLPLPFQVLGYGGLAALAGVFGGFLLGGWRKPSRAETARWVDLQQHLQERLSTALEVANDPAAGQWRDLVVSDAAQHAKKVDPRQLLPWRLPQAAQWTLLVLAVSAGLGFVPEYRSQTYLQKKREAQNIRETGQRLAELVRKQILHRPPANEPPRKTIEDVAELGERLSQVKLTRNEALRDLAKITDKLKQDLTELARSPDLRRMEQAARSPTGANEQPAQALQKRLDDLQKALGEKTANNPEALEHLKRDLEKLKEAAAGMQSKDSADLSAARKELAKALSSLSQQAQNLGVSLPGLEAAIEALRNAQTELFLRDLELAMDDLEKMREMAKAMERLQQQLEQLGKDLAQQLEYGQAQAAQRTLGKMIEQLKSASLTDEQLKKLIDEVAKAVDPGSQYGKVGQCLGSAVAQMQQGQKGAAAQSLAEAAAELQRLMDQMADAQALAATLATLDHAQFAIGNCMGWGQCSGKCKSGKHGQCRGTGGGFGDWRDDDDNFSLPEMNDFWWNSLERPTLNPRGVTDRGEPELSDALLPTKVRGQFNPGGAMPSITLKGVSIAGRSRVEIQQAMVAAQSEAESALSQEQVPRAYQNAVRDYFDDSKE